MGDVFAVERGGGPGLLGRVVSTSAVVGPTHGCILVYVCVARGRRPGREDLLVPPMLTTRAAWSRGYFVHLRSEPLLPGEYLERHVFRDAQGRFYDEEARPAAAPAPGEPVGEWKLLEVEAIEAALAAAVALLPPERVAPSPSVGEPEGYELQMQVPDVDEYVRLRRESGLSPKTPEAARVGLPNTWFGVTMRHKGEAVGMGRVLGDGACFFEVVDIAVLPAHQRRGLGKRIMEALVEHLRRHAPAGAHVMLLADGPAHQLYEQFGFRATAPASIGMELRL
jgi:ribosomal protein S18 acetylase RimI-like enzyme